ncbi:hypothetical protein K438DRAFT_859558 [Mycena galopus ATCC 62051]|nr:hypothetical protein K438DRAFT_859558 [Mycena galopus ATCC 62051]
MCWRLGKAGNSVASSSSTDGMIFFQVLSFSRQSNAIFSRAGTVSPRTVASRSPSSAKDGCSAEFLRNKRGSKKTTMVRVWRLGKKDSISLRTDPAVRSLNETGIVKDVIEVGIMLPPFRSRRSRPPALPLVKERVRSMVLRRSTASMKGIEPLQARSCGAKDVDGTGPSSHRKMFKVRSSTAGKAEMHACKRVMDVPES